MSLEMILSVSLVPNESYKKLFDSMNATAVKRLIISYGTTEDGRPLIADQVNI